MMYLILLMFEDGVKLSMIVTVIAFLCVNGALQSYFLLYKLKELWTEKWQMR